MLLRSAIASVLLAATGALPVLAATPAPIVAKINAEFNAVLGIPETRERLGAQGVEPRGGTPAEFASFLRSEIPKWTRVMRDSGARAD